MKTRILYLTGGMRVGGMETHILRLASGLDETFESIVGCLHPSEQYLGMLHGAGLNAIDLKCPTLTSPKAFARLLSLRRLLQAYRPHIVHTYGFGADVVGAILRSTRPHLRFITSRRSEDNNARHQGVRRVTNAVTHKIVCVSDETARFVLATEKPRRTLIEVIPNGVDIPPEPRPLRVADGNMTFGTLGNLLPVKGTDLLVDAFLRFAPSEKARLVVAGLVDRPWAQALRNRAELDPRIRFLGRSSDPTAFLSTLDVFVLPSRSEGMSNALLEAMALGLPCVVTDVGSNRALLAPGNMAPGGIVCEPTVEALFTALRTVGTRPDLGRQLGENAASIARTRHDITNMYRHYERLYLDVLSAPVRRSYAHAASRER